MADNVSLIKTEVDQLVTLAPQDPYAHFFKSLSFAIDGEMGQSYTELKKARELGLPEDLYQGSLDEFGISTYLRFINTIKAVGFSFGGWLLGFSILIDRGKPVKSKIDWRPESVILTNQLRRHPLRNDPSLRV